MPFKNKDVERMYKKEYARKRRIEIMKGKSCFVCGTTENLENHHIDKSTKITHKFNTRKKEFVENEMKKCIQLCKKHHVELHAAERRIPKKVKECL